MESDEHYAMVYPIVQSAIRGVRPTDDDFDAYARMIQDRYSLTGEFHDLEMKAARRIRKDIISILKRHLLK